MKRMNIQIPLFSGRQLKHLVFEKIAAGEGVEPSVSAFKAQRVAGYTIPQERVGAAGLEPASRADPALAAYKTAALPLCYAPKN